MSRNSKASRLFEEDKAHLRMLGRYIQHYRRRAGLSRTQLAAKLGFTTRDWNRLESGSRNITRSELNALEELIGIDIKEAENICRVGNVLYLLKIYEALDEHYQD